MNFNNKLFFSLILATTIFPTICMQRIKNQHARLNVLTRNSKSWLPTTRTHSFHNSAIIKEELNNVATREELTRAKGYLKAHRDCFFDMYLKSKRKIKILNDLSILPMAIRSETNKITGQIETSEHDYSLAFQQFADGCDYFFAALKEGEKAQKRKFGIIAGLGLLGTVGGVAIGWHLKSQFNDTNEK